MTSSQLNLITAEIPDSLDGMRLDKALASLFSDFSRSRLQRWIRDGLVEVDDEILRAKDKVFSGQKVSVQVIEQAEVVWQAQDIPLDIVYEDAQLIVLNKPHGMVVHPAAGNYSGTMLNALLHYAPELENVPRAGIVHRLDKGTSGLLVVARDLATHKYLVEQLQDRAFEREYRAIVSGVMTAGGRVDEPIGRHRVNRTKMAVLPPGKQGGKPAVTHYRVEERYRAHTLVRVKLETGRTHQIRVHMAYIKFPVVGDPVYAGRLKLPKGCSDELTITLRGFKRQALHAFRLGVIHPQTEKLLTWEAPVPEDMQNLQNILRTDLKEGDRG